MYITVSQIPAPLTAPLGAPIAGWVAAQVVLGLRAIGRGLRAVAKAAAERPTVISRDCEAAAVRRYAQQMLSHDPRFAADLYAAADRHERGE